MHLLNTITSATPEESLQLPSSPRSAQAKRSPAASTGTRWPDAACDDEVRCTSRSDTDRLKRRPRLLSSSSYCYNAKTKPRARRTTTTVGPAVGVSFRFKESSAYGTTTPCYLGYLGGAGAQLLLQGGAAAAVGVPVISECWRYRSPATFTPFHPFFPTAGGTAE